MNAEDQVRQTDPSGTGEKVERGSRVRERSCRRTGLPDLDWPLLFCVLLLLGFGFVMVSSASMPIADRTSATPFYFII